MCRRPVPKQTDRDSLCAGMDSLGTFYRDHLSDDTQRLQFLHMIVKLTAERTSTGMVFRWTDLVPEQTGLTRKPHNKAYDSERAAYLALLEHARAKDDFLCTVLLNDDVPELLMNT